MKEDWSDFKVEPPPNGLSLEVHSLCSQFGLHPYLGVLCGWDWAIKNKDVKPVYQVELIRGSSKTTINTDKADVLNKVMKIYK